MLFMLFFIFYQFVVCISLFALFFLSVDCLLLLRRRGKSRKEMLNLVMVMALWMITAYQTLYKGLPVSFSAYYIFDVLYRIVALWAGVYVAKQLMLVRKVKEGAKRYFALLTTTVGTSTVQATEKLRTIWLYPSKIRKVDEVLNTEIYESKITIEKLSSKTGINRTYLSRYFNIQMGVSYLKYAEKKRLRRVIEELENTEKPITVIYENAGFTASSFYSTFKATYEMTPEQWRKAHRQKVLNEKQ